MVQKPDIGAWRPCEDFRKLNAKTVRDRYPIPHLHDFAIGLQGTTIFTKLDLVKAYYQIPVTEENVKKTAITSLFGFYEFLRMSLRDAVSVPTHEDFRTVVDSE